MSTNSGPDRRHADSRFFVCFLISVSGIIFFSSTHLSIPPKLSTGRKYRTVERIAPERLQAVSEARGALRRNRREVALKHGLTDYRAILHAHAEDSAHTGGTRPELLAAAKKTGVKVILLTDHVRPPRDFINDSWRGLREGILFIPGAESEGFLAYPTRSVIAQHKPKSWKSRDEYIDLIKAEGGNIFLSHVEEKYDWETARLDGLEIYNNHTDMEDELEFLGWLRGALTDPARLRQLEEMLKTYPLEVFGSLQDYLAPIIAKWDRDLLDHPLTGIAANDCHHNQVYEIKAAGADAIEISILGDPPRKVTTQQAPRIAEMLNGRRPGDLIARIDLDPYESSLQFVSTHLLLPALNEEAVRQALRSGHAYVSHDWLCDPTGFAFIAERNGRRAGVMGDRIKLEKNLRLRLAAPAEGIVRLFRNGTMIDEVRAGRLDWPVTEPGVYRAEIWLEIDGEQRPWIYANPIRVE